MKTQKKKIIGFSSVIILAIAAWFGIRMLPDAPQQPSEVIPPSLSNITATYVTSTNEVVIGWYVDNAKISEYNTGVRYDVVSHGTTTVTSKSYPSIKFSTKKDNGFEARILITEEEELFYRIQVAHNNEFLWSDEGIILIPEK